MLMKPYKQQVNLSTQAEVLFSEMLTQLEHQAWAIRNDNALRQHGEEIRKNGLAGAEFTRV